MTECVTCEHIFECKILHSDGMCINYKKRKSMDKEEEKHADDDQD